MSDTAGRDQDLRVLPQRYRIELSQEAPEPCADSALATVHGPDGWTTVTQVTPDQQPSSEAGETSWVALWSGDQPHEPTATGMLAALIRPLAAAGIPVMALSTHSADLVLLPQSHLPVAISALSEAGHRIAASTG